MVLGAGTVGQQASVLPSLPSRPGTEGAVVSSSDNYWLGGKDNFAADRVVAEQVIVSLPDIRLSVRAQRAFLGRAVHYLAAEAGIRQFRNLPNYGAVARKPA